MTATECDHGTRVVNTRRKVVECACGQWSRPFVDYGRATIAKALITLGIHAFKSSLGTLCVATGGTCGLPEDNLIHLDFGGPLSPGVCAVAVDDDLGCIRTEGHVEDGGHWAVAPETTRRKVEGVHRGTNLAVTEDVIVAADALAEAVKATPSELRLSDAVITELANYIAVRGA